MVVIVVLLVIVVCLLIAATIIDQAYIYEMNRIYDEMSKLTHHSINNLGDLIKEFKSFDNRIDILEARLKILEEAKEDD